MTAEEIRAKLKLTAVGNETIMTAWMLNEIAAQLAELNEHIMAGELYVGDFGKGSDFR